MNRVRLVLSMAVMSMAAAPATPQSSAGRSDAGGVPSPPTVPVRLRNGGTAGPLSAPSGCVTPVVSSSLPPSRVQPLGAHMVGEPVGFHVGPHTGTISIIEQALGSPPQAVEFGSPPYGFPIRNAAVATLITEPDGTVIFDDTEALPGDLTTAHVVVGPPLAYTGVLTLPNTTQAFRDSEDGGYPEGDWSVQVNDYALECTLPLYSGFCSGGTSSDRYDLTVITKPVARRTGTVDVSIYLASESLRLEETLASAGLRRFVGTLSTLYDRAGLRLGAVTVYDLPPWAKARYATGVDAFDTGPCSDLGQLLTLSQPGNELSFFFVDAIRAGDGGFNVVGIDGSIPGPASLGGTVASGAAVNASDLGRGRCGSELDFEGCGADEVAYITAHEGGHYMGLFHTTEAFGDFFDPLRDTPECRCSTACLSASSADLCASFQLVLTADLCTQAGKSECGGGDNLMFWLLQPPITQGNLSAEQGRVVRASPVVH